MGWLLRLDFFHIKKSHRIHKRLLDAVEDQAAQEDDHQHEAEAVEQITQFGFARAQEGVAEGLHDGRHRVGQDNPLEALRDGRARVDNRRGVHEQLHAEGDQETQVTVFSSERGDDDAEAQAEDGRYEDYSDPNLAGGSHQGKTRIIPNQGNLLAQIGEGCKLMPAP